MLLTLVGKQPGEYAISDNDRMKANIATAERSALLQSFKNALNLDEILSWSTTTKALYTSDASLYRLVPTVVATPRTREELIACVRAALKVGLPITGRGAGTSIAGNAVGEGLIIDMRRYLNKVLSIDPETRTAVVEPGVVQSVLQTAAKPYGLRFGPDPSTSNRCTIGGMIGNNACGPRALGYGRSADNIVSLEIITGTGELLTIGEGGDKSVSPLPELGELVRENLALIRTEFGKFSRQTSGYSMEHLLPEFGFEVGKFFAGTEGTLGIITQATIRLVSDAPHQVTIALGYPTMPEGADDMPHLIKFQPVAAEGMDARIVDVVRRRKGNDAVPHLPEGNGWVFLEVVGDDLTEVTERAEALVAASQASDGWVVKDPGEAKALWTLRSDGAGLAGVSFEQLAYPGWEDAAVPVERLGNYLRDFDALLLKHGFRGLPYGHFGEGCVHCRIDFPLDQPGGTEKYRQFMLDAGRLVASHGGSMSGEHGDGRARSELLPLMYSTDALQLFKDVKELFDPRELLNPGVVVDPVSTAADVRAAQTIHSPLRKTDPQFVHDVHQCSGVGKCLADTSDAGGVMCPSYLATDDPLHSTRGRARILQEMVNGQLIKGWRAPEVHEALELCLACKGCRRDCPTGIDVAAYKSRVLDETYKGRIRPMRHYAIGWLPRWGRMVTQLPLVGYVANFFMQAPGTSNLIKLIAGVDQRRPMPKFRSDGSARSSENAEPIGDAWADRPRVAIWVDSFTDSFEGDQLAPMVAVLASAGYAPRVIQDKACCGLTWITTGQLDGARRQMSAALDVLYPIAAAGVPIVGMEPSCQAVWKSDAPELLPDDERVPVVAAAMHTLAETLLAAPDFKVPDLTGHTIVAQPHCHQASVLGWKADRKVLARTGAKVVTVSGCCGLAGNFGIERGHYELSVAVAETNLLPAIHAAGEDAILLADGFSCRKQISDLESRDAMTMAQLLAAHL